MEDLEIHGDVFGQVAGGDIHNYGPVVIAPPGSKIKIVIQPGPEHIDQKKASILKLLVTEIARLEALLNGKKRSYAAVWHALNARLRVTSYHLIQNQDFPRAEKYLREWIGRLSSKPGAAANDPNWRNRKFTYIFTNVRTLKADADLQRHMELELKVQSLRALDDYGLEKLYRTVAGWKKAGHAPSQAKPETVPEGAQGKLPASPDINNARSDYRGIG